MLKYNDRLDAFPSTASGIPEHYSSVEGQARLGTINTIFVEICTPLFPAARSLSSQGQ